MFCVMFSNCYLLLQNYSLALYINILITLHSLYDMLYCYVFAEKLCNFTTETHVLDT